MEEIIAPELKNWTLSILADEVEEYRIFGGCLPTFSQVAKEQAGKRQSDLSHNGLLTAQLNKK